MNSDILGVLTLFFLGGGEGDNFHLLKVQNRNMYVGMLNLQVFWGRGLRGGGGWVYLFFSGKQ